MGCLPVRKIIHSLKLVDYLHVQADNPWYNYYIKEWDIALILRESMLSGYKPNHGL